jgi:hypothetical protein
MWKKKKKKNKNSNGEDVREQLGAACVKFKLYGLVLVPFITFLFSFYCCGEQTMCPIQQYNDEPSTGYKSSSCVQTASSLQQAVTFGRRRLRRRLLAPPSSLGRLRVQQCRELGRNFREHSLPQHSGLLGRKRRKNKAHHLRGKK